VYHGTPHKFDKFDVSKVGTGQGAQSYGHGLYFAENPNTGEVYQRGLSDWGVEVGGKRITPGNKTEDAALAWVQTGKDAQAEDAFQYAKRAARNALGKSSSLADDIAKTIDGWQAGGAKVVGGGYLYKANIHPTPDKFLDWDKPLSEQSESVKGSIREVLDRLVNEEPDFHVASRLSRELAFEKNMSMTGKDIYQIIMNQNKGGGWADTPNQQAASELLNSLGIPGIRYLDQGSRGAGKGTYNYVVFSDKDVSIIK